MKQEGTSWFDDSMQRAYEPRENGFLLFDRSDWPAYNAADKAPTTLSILSPCAWVATEPDARLWIEHREREIQTLRGLRVKTTYEPV